MINNIGQIETRFFMPEQYTQYMCFVWLASFIETCASCFFVPPSKPGTHVVTSILIYSRICKIFSYQFDGVFFSLLLVQLQLIRINPKCVLFEMILFIFVSLGTTIFIWWFLHQRDKKKRTHKIPFECSSNETFFVSIDCLNKRIEGPIQAFAAWNWCWRWCICVVRYGTWIYVITIACSIVCDCAKENLYLHVHRAMCINIHRLCAQWRNCDWIIMIVFDCFCTVQNFILCNAIHCFCMTQ